MTIHGPLWRPTPADIAEAEAKQMEWDALDRGSEIEERGREVVEAEVKHRGGVARAANGGDHPEPVVAPWFDTESVVAFGDDFVEKDEEGRKKGGPGASHMRGKSIEKFELIVRCFRPRESADVVHVLRVRSA